MVVEKKVEPRSKYKPKEGTTTKLTLFLRLIKRFLAFSVLFPAPMEHRVRGSCPSSTSEPDDHNIGQEQQQRRQAQPHGHSVSSQTARREPHGQYADRQDVVPQMGVVETGPHANRD